MDWAWVSAAKWQPDVPKQPERSGAIPGTGVRLMFYVPSLRATIAGTVNRADQNNRWLFERVLHTLEDATL